jgi:AGZA family xanthine/uracil permease-like MFS transporter
MSSIGIIHSANLHWPEFSAVSLGYMIAAAFLLIYPIFHREDAIVPEAEHTPEPQASPAE